MTNRGSGGPSAEAGNPAGEGDGMGGLTNPSDPMFPAPIPDSPAVLVMPCSICGKDVFFSVEGNLMTVGIEYESGRFKPQCLSCQRSALSPS